MRRLDDTPELLDGPLDDPAALAANLRDLRRVNRLLGGSALSARAIDALLVTRTGPRSGPVSLLDVGTGAADIPEALLDRAARDGTNLSIAAVDARPEVLAAALAIRPRLAGEPRLRLAPGDARSLGAPDASHEIVHASMLLHHLEALEVLQVLREMRRVAALGVVVNELNRSRLGWFGAWLIGHLLTRSRLTRNDAPLSVRRAFTIAEMRGLLVEAGLRPIYTAVGPFGHRYAIAAVRDPAT
jgi:hypothetical protein